MELYRTWVQVAPDVEMRFEVLAGDDEHIVMRAGGYGTADETFEMLTWAQLKLHAKPVGVLNLAGFFDPLLAWIDRCIAEDFLKPRYRQFLLVENDVERMLDVLTKAASVGERSL